MKVKRDGKGRFIKGERNISWKGGKNYDNQGYVRIWKPDHPFNNFGYVLEHRLVIEKKIGRFLKKSEVVHHINGVRDDNKVKNLIIMTRHIHPANHQIGRKLPQEVKNKISKKLMGHPNFKKI
jgi:hypothetical protein